MDDWGSSTKHHRDLAFESRAVTRLRVRVLEGPDAGTVWDSKGDESCAIGTSSDNQLVLRDPTVSRYHVEISRTATGVRVADLQSTNGTVVAGLRIEAAIVPAGSRISLGATTLLLEEASENVLIESVPAAIPGLVGSSRAIRRVVERLHRLAPSPVTVLVQGETGTGKEVVARALHDLSPRKDAPFEVVDCASLPANLIASELFGHERGAFTGAHQRHVGAFERAKGGTIFLDEIGDLPLDLQPALLGVLERRTIRRVGGIKEVPVDVRVVAATHRDLRGGANGGSFRSDLYFRLAVARIELPPLRLRVEDLPALAKHFADDFLGKGGSARLQAEWLASLPTRSWPGNVRELRNAVESHLTLAELAAEDAASDGYEEADPPSTSTQISLDEVEEVLAYGDARSAVLDQFEREYLSKLMAICRNNASEASRRAKMDRRYLLTLLRRNGLR